MAVTVGSGADRSSGNYALIESLRRWGITFYSGVNGGGVIHVAKHLEPFTDLSQAADGVPRFLTMSEYASGFVPVGYYLASGRVAGSITTTGAATKLGSSGITDAKLHNIPAVYLIALNSTLSIGLAPIQDVSEYGMNIVPQLQAELGEGCIVLDNIHELEGQLRRYSTSHGQWHWPSTQMSCPTPFAWTRRRLSPREALTATTSQRSSRSFHGWPRTAEWLSMSGKKRRAATGSNP